MKKHKQYDNLTLTLLAGLDKKRVRKLRERVLGADFPRGLTKSGQFDIIYKNFKKQTET